MTTQTEKALITLAMKLLSPINPLIASNRKERKAITAWNNDRINTAIYIRKIVDEETKLCHPERSAAESKDVQREQPQPEPQPESNPEPEPQPQ